MGEMVILRTQVSKSRHGAPDFVVVPVAILQTQVSESKPWGTQIRGGQR